MTDRRDTLDPPPAAAPSRESGRSVPDEATRGLRPRAVRVAVALAGLILVVAGLREAALRLGAWLRLRPEYQVQLDDFEVEPPPPDCLRGGRRALLRQIAASWGLGETISALAVQPADLARRIALSSAWIEAVEEVAIIGHPPQVRVVLRYRQPVAVLAVAGREPILLDRHGVVLPAAEVDPARVGPLIALRGWRGPIDPRPGFGLAPSGSEAETGLRAATRLCEFLGQRAQDGPDRPRIVAVNLRYGASSLYAQTDRGLWVLWGEAPGSELPGQLDASRKWEQLRSWLATHSGDSDAASGAFLVFTADGPRLERHRAEPRSGD